MFQLLKSDDWMPNVELLWQDVSNRYCHWSPSIPEHKHPAHDDINWRRFLEQNIVLQFLISDLWHIDTLLDDGSACVIWVSCITNLYLFLFSPLVLVSSVVYTKCWNQLTQYHSLRTLEQLIYTNEFSSTNDVGHFPWNISFDWSSTWILTSSFTGARGLTGHHLIPQLTQLRRRIV